MDIANIMGQARKMQERFSQLQEQLASRTVTGEAGGGMVSVVANGRFEIVSMRIAPELLAGGDAAMVQDLVAAAVNQALQAARELAQQELSSITGGVKIPGLTL